MRRNDNQLAVFEGRQIRKVFHEAEWWFSIIDVVEVLVGGDRPRKYWSDLKKKLFQEGYDQLSEKIGQLKMPSSDGKQGYRTPDGQTGSLARELQAVWQQTAEETESVRGLTGWAGPSATNTLK